MMNFLKKTVLSVLSLSLLLISSSLLSHTIQIENKTWWSGKCDIKVWGKVVDSVHIDNADFPKLKSGSIWGGYVYTGGKQGFAVSNIRGLCPTKITCDLEWQGRRETVESSPVELAFCGIWTFSLNYVDSLNPKDIDKVVLYWAPTNWKRLV